MPSIRLQKFLAEAGVASRRQCEELIVRGEITVNGRAVTALGTKIETDKDQVTVAGKPVSPQRKVYVALHKPAGVLCTNRDTHGRKCAIDLLPSSLPRVFPVGRLDQDTTGLLLLTNDGNLSLRLTHPRYKMPKTYEMEVEGELTGMQIARLLQGVRSEGERLRAEKIWNVRTRGGSTQLRMVLREGKKRQIRRMLDAVGHPVKWLMRLTVGAVSLGDLKQGQWRYLSHEEVRELMQSEPSAPTR